VSNPNVSLEALMITDEEARRFEGGRRWRTRGRAVDERPLIQVVDRKLFSSAADWLAFLPEGLESFTTGDLAEAAGVRLDLAQKLACFLREAGNRRVDRPSGSVQQVRGRSRMTGAVEEFARRSAHGDLAEVFGRALGNLGEYELHGGGPGYKAVYATTNGIAFGGATGMADTHWRLGPEDRTIAIKSGGEESDLGPDWIRIVLFLNNWPEPDLAHWARRAYAFARGQ
jgi:hypothetical protein